MISFHTLLIIQQTNQQVGGHLHTSAKKRWFHHAHLFRWAEVLQSQCIILHKDAFGPIISIITKFTYVGATWQNIRCPDPKCPICKFRWYTWDRWNRDRRCYLSVNKCMKNFELFQFLFSGTDTIPSLATDHDCSVKAQFWSENQWANETWFVQDDSHYY